MVKPVWNNAQRVNHQNFAKKSHPCVKKNMVPKAVLMKSGLVSINTARQNMSKTSVLVNTGRQVNPAHSKTTVNAARPMSYLSKTAYSTDQGVMEDMLLLEGTPKEGKSQENVPLKLLIDESQVLLRVPRKNNMYSVDLKNIVPKGGLTCLFAKAISDESKLWHRRLGHLNFKTMNKLVKGNLIRGLPSKLFENDQTCVACQKGKQHRASCKFNGKADEGLFVGYSLNSKAFRVFNSRTMIVEENLHIRYKASDMQVKQERNKPDKDYILLPLWTADPPFSQNPKSSDNDGSKPSSYDGKKVGEDPRKDSEPNKVCDVLEYQVKLAYTDSDYARASLDRKSTTEKLLWWKDIAAIHKLTTAVMLIVVEVPQSSVPSDNVADKAVYKELDDILVRAATTASSLEAEQDSETMGDTFAQTRFENVSKLSNDPLLQRVLDLEITKTTQANEIASLKRKVKKLKQKKRSRTHRLKRLYKVGLTARVESSGDEESLEVVVKDVNLTVDEVTLAQALAALKSVKPKVKSNVVEELSVPVSAASTKAKVQDKGKEKMIEPKKPLKKKDQSSFDKQEAIRLQAEFEEEERLAREKDEANVTLIKEWDDIQAKVNADYQLAQRLQAKEEEQTDLVEGSSKRAGDELEQEVTKKQKVDNVQETAKVDDGQEAAKIKDLMKIFPDEEEVAIDAIPLANKPPNIVDWKIHKEGKKNYYQIIRADRSSKMYIVFSHMLKSFDREDFETLWKLVKVKYGSTRPTAGEVTTISTKLLLLEEVTTASGRVNAASEEVSTAELESIVIGIGYSLKEKNEAKKRTKQSPRLERALWLNGRDELLRDERRRLRVADVFEDARESEWRERLGEMSSCGLMHTPVDADKETAELQSLIEFVPDEEEVAIDAIPLATKPLTIVD
ncbi:ribonuclease H-like domain-containing protein [Tanacetum coccineum]